MLEVVRHLRKHFDSLSDRMETFARQGVQVEGWFKGEVLHALEALTRRGEIRRFDREVSHVRSKVDFFVERDGAHWIELKHWLVGTQRGTRYNAYWYFSDVTLGIKGDVAKLNSIDGDIGRWLLILLAANPGRADWERGIAKFNAKFAPLRVTSCTNPEEFPPSYFLGLLRVSPQPT